MSYNSKLPMDDEYIASGPADIRENFRALKEDQIVNAGTLAGLPAGNANGNIPKSNGIVNTNLNADLLDGHEATDFATASHTHSAATTSTSGFMSAVDKTKMDGIATGAQVNQNAFGNVVVGTTTIQADSATDTLTLTAGTNISLTPDATNDAVTIAVSGTVPSATTAATCSGNAATATKWATARTLSFTGDATGSMSVDGSAAANAALTLKSTGVTAGTYRSVTVDAQGRVTAGANPTSESIDITGNAATATACGGVGTTAIDISNTNLNLATRPTGFYRGLAMTNAPNTGWFYVVHISHDLGSWIYQEAISYGSSNTANLVYTRCLVNGVWSAWSQVAHISDIAANAVNWNTLGSFSGSTAGAFYPGISVGPSAYGSGTVTVSALTQAKGIAAGTYALSTVIQGLVTLSHSHSSAAIAATGTASNCNCNCDCSGGSCFIAGTLILMEDWSLRKIEDLVVGDRVRGLTGVNTIIKPYQNTLGNKRSIMTFNDNSLCWTGEHLMWIKTADDEFFGTCDFNHHLREKNPMRFPAFKGYTLSEREAIVICEPVQFAHISGWVVDEPIVNRTYGDNTKVFSAIVDGDHTFIANGYVVGGFVHDDDFDYSKAKWQKLL